MNRSHRPGRWILWRRLALLAFSLQVLGGEAAARLTAYNPFCLTSDDGNRILIIQGWDYGWGEKALQRDEDPYGWCPKKFRERRLPSGANVDLLRDFPSSGVYTLPARTLVYPLDSLCLEENLIASNDLSSLVLLNHTGNSVALLFLENGKLVKAYTLEDLLLAFSDYRYRTLTSDGWYYPWHDEFRTVGRDSVVLTTVKREFMRLPLGYYERHRFDLKTGCLEKTEVFYGNVVAVPGIGGLLFGFGVVALMLRVRRSRKGDHTHPQTE